jgi:UDP-N-acetylmuramoyl-tripeptide--D-alanyl-D-alanine ligase
VAVSWTLTDIAHILGAEAAVGNGVSLRRVSRVVIDSRTVEAGDLFVALPGARFDGHDFIAQAAERGAAAAVVARPAAFDIPQIVVTDTAEALRALARARRREFAGPVVAVTGSCGKTTTKDFIAEVLGRKYRVRSSYGNLNNEYGVPLSLLALEDEDDVLVVELGVSAPGDMALIAAVAMPTVAVITSVAPTHLEFFGDVAAVRREKGAPTIR